MTHQNRNHHGRRPQDVARHNEEAGWVLLSALLFSTIMAALTVTWARHAILARNYLDVENGASQAEESCRSGLARLRSMMRNSEIPGGCETGEEDLVEAPSGDFIVTERHVTGHGQRSLRLRAQNQSAASSEQTANLRAVADVVPGDGSTGDVRTGLTCETGTALLTAGLLTIIAADTDLVDTQVAGLYLVEDGVTLNLQNVQLRGTIITRAGLCQDNLPATGANQPRINMSGDCRLLAGTELPDVAMVAPDARFETDLSSRVEVDGFLCADQVLVQGRATMRGMVVSGQSESLGTGVSRPGAGRSVQDWPASIRPGAERIVRVAFPSDDVPEVTLDAMEAFDADS